MADKAQFEKSAAELDLEARQKSGNRSSRILSTSDLYEAPENDGGRDFRVEGNKVDGYIGVDPIYQTYANDTDRPGSSSKNPADKVAEEFVANLDPKPELPEEPEEDDDEPDEVTGGTAGATTPAANPDGSSVVVPENKG